MGSRSSPSLVTRVHRNASHSKIRGNRATRTRLFLITIFSRIPAVGRPLPLLRQAFTSPTSQPSPIGNRPSAHLLRRMYVPPRRLLKLLFLRDFWCSRPARKWFLPEPPRRCNFA